MAEGVKLAPVKILLIYGFLSCLFVVRAQQNTRLEQQVRTKYGKEKVRALFRYGLWWESYNLDSAANYYKQAGALSRKIGYTHGQFTYYSNYTYILNQKGALKEGLKLNLEALALARRKGTKQELADCLFNAGSSYNNLGLFDEALQLYLESSKKLEVLGDEQSLSIVYDNIGGVYTNSSQYQEALKYHQKAYRLAKRLKDQQAMVKILINKGITELLLKQMADAKADLELGLKRSEEIGNPYLQSIAYKNLSEWYCLKKNPDQSLAAARKAYRLAKMVKSNYAEYEALKVLTASFAAAHQSDSVIYYGKETFSFGLRNQFTTDLYKMSEFLAKAYERKGNLDSALYYFKQFKKYNDSLLLSGERIKMKLVQNDYQKAKNQNEILHLQSSQKKQKWIIWSLVCTILVLSALAFLLFKITQSKRQIIEQEINALKQEEDLKAAQLILETQEEERLRIAKDLHDGLGGLLSGIKLTIQNSEALKANERKALHQLDEAMQEMRRISHSMMPEALNKFGLVDALKDICKSLEDSDQLQVSCQFFGLEQRLSGELETNLYRIILELINNAIKHAEATEIYLQLLHQDETITITIEDNGSGFDAGNLDQVQGMGFRNIQSRLKLMNGTWEIHSEYGKGTSIHLEINTRLHANKKDKYFYSR